MYCKELGSLLSLGPSVSSVCWPLCSLSGFLSFTKVICPQFHKLAETDCLF